MNWQGEGTGVLICKGIHVAIARYFTERFVDLGKLASPKSASGLSSPFIHTFQLPPQKLENHINGFPVDVKFGLVGSFKIGVGVYLEQKYKSLPVDYKIKPVNLKASAASLN